MSSIHPTAIIADGAVVADDVEIGPYCIIGPDVKLATGVRLHAHVVVEGHTEVGEGTEIWPSAQVGGAPQDINYKGEPTAAVIGRNCVIREFATIHRGTPHGRARTEIGDNCFMMLGSHVAHDCIVGNGVILTNNATLGGHCVLGDDVIVGGLSAVQQRVHIGTQAFVGGMSAVTSHIVPYSISAGNRATLGGLNVVGLKRRGFDREAIHALRNAYKLYFDGEGSRQTRLAAVREAHADHPPVLLFADFVEARGEQPLALPRRGRSDQSG